MSEDIREKSSHQSHIHAGKGATQVHIMQITPNVHSENASQSHTRTTHTEDMEIHMECAQIGAHSELCTTQRHQAPAPTTVTCLQPDPPPPTLGLPQRHLPAPIPGQRGSPSFQSQTPFPILMGFSLLSIPSQLELIPRFPLEAPSFPPENLFPKLPA